MRLLILTQRVNKEDDVLGFFHQWLLEFARHFEFITVICLEEGDHDFYSIKNAKSRSENSAEFSGTGIKVLSLGKELAGKGLSSRKSIFKEEQSDGKKFDLKRGETLRKQVFLARLKYIYRFYKYIWHERKNYDAVFVHMNIEYTILGGIWWRLIGKKVYLWYNHTYGTIYARIAGIISHKVFHTSPFAFTAKFKNSVQMPAGIDTDIFAQDDNAQKYPNSILYIGRISPVKHIETLLKASELLDKKDIIFILDIYGSSPERDREYYKKLRRDFKILEDKGKVRFFSGVPNYQTPRVYNTHEIAVNLTPKGNFDKTVLEAMSCGTLSLVSSEAFKDMLPKEFLFEENNLNNLADKIEKIFNMKYERKLVYAEEMRKKVIEKQSLSILTEKLVSLINNK